MHPQKSKSAQSVSVSMLLLAVAIGTTARALGQIDVSVARPPAAQKQPKALTIHGEERVDDYYWLREKSNPAVKTYLDAENAYTNAVMKPTEPMQEKLYAEMLGRIKQTDLSVPYRQGQYWYYTRTEEGKQYPINCRKTGGRDSKEEITVDLNELGKGKKFISLGSHLVSDDGNWLAFRIDTSGFREYTLFIKDLRTGKVLTDRIERVSTAAWAADNRTLFYVTEDAAKRPYRLHRHVVGETKDAMLYEEKDELYRLAVSRSRDRRYNFARSNSSTSSEERYVPSDRPLDSWRVIVPREPEHRYSVDHRDGAFLITTNKDAKNFRLVKTPVASPEPKNWQELVPHRADVLLENVHVFAGYAMLAERTGGLPRLRVLHLRNGQTDPVELPDLVCSVFGDANPEFDSTVFRLRYQSLTTPDSVYDYDVENRRRVLLKQTEVLGGFDPARYRTERIAARASDGTSIPITVVSRKDVARDGRAPLLLYGYGAYGASLPITFAIPRVSLLDRGVVYAMAHIRGGKDLGETWHDQGKMMNKRNTFTDFIAAADHLVAAKYTSKERLVIQGGSAGGLLIGAVVNLRPDLCRAAVLEVPFVDVINTMLDASLPLTVQEYLEWGNPNVKKDYEYMKSYCPYTNLAAKNYPAMLIRTSLNDSQVMYWEPAKYVAKLRTLKTDANVLLLKTNMAAGHGGASGRYDALRETAFLYAFILQQMGITG